MKSPSFIRCLCAVLLASFPLVLLAVEAVKIEPVLYLFRRTSIPRIDLGKALQGRPPLSGNVIVFGQPATVVFERERLVLERANYSWNDGGKVPPQFSETVLPAIVTAVGQAASIRAVVPIQYLEKMPDGSLQVREISGNLPDMPHYQLTLSVQPATEATSGYDMVVTCQMDISTVQGREKIPGVELEVGRPILARFNEGVEFMTRSGEWSGLLVGSVASSDYTLLILLKVSSISDATTGAHPMQPASAVPSSK